MSWFNVTHRADVTRVFVHGEIGTWGIGFDEFARELGDAKTVELRIASPGGDSNTALRIAQLLSERDTVATFTGVCCSSAVTLAMTAKRITAHSTARLMVHSPINFCFGNPAELRQQADELERIVAPIKELYSRRCPAALVETWFNGADYWMDATEALGVGLVDEIIEAPILLDREVEPAAAATSAPDDSQTEDESFILDLLRVTQGASVRSRTRLAQHLNVWLASTKEV